MEAAVNSRSAAATRYPCAVHLPLPGYACLVRPPARRYPATPTRSMGRFSAVHGNTKNHSTATISAMISISDTSLLNGPPGNRRHSHPYKA